jgi:hypothetical protein
MPHTNQLCPEFHWYSDLSVKWRQLTVLVAIMQVS